jgi:ataxia telangiectasia mutated family protein
LPTPEQVPFRLTPDIVDGFGISGVEGVFRKCSEETIRVLRSKSAVLMTILEVFKYDPLQKWYGSNCKMSNVQLLTNNSRTASASKVRRIQGSQALDRGEENTRTAELTDADRAIRTVSEKLRSDLSVEYNVNE